MSFGAGFGDVYLIKTDSIGDIRWTKTYGGVDWDAGLAVQQTTDGGYIVAGRTSSFGAGGGNVYLIKTDSIGDTLWTKTYGGGDWDEGYAIQQTTDGGYIVAGRTESFGVGFGDVYLIKTDSIGDTLWTKTYGGGDWDEGYAIQQTTDGGYIVAGDTWSFGAGLTEVYLIKTDSNGNSGCNEMGTATSVSSGGVVGTTATLVGSGAIVNNTATIVTNPATIESNACDTTTGIDQLSVPSTWDYKLSIYPNPYTAKTQITYTLSPLKKGVRGLSDKVIVLLEIYNILGQRIHTLVNEQQQAGTYQYTFSAKELGYAAGLYILKLSVGEHIYQRKLVEY